MTSGLSDFFLNANHTIFFHRNRELQPTENIFKKTLLRTDKI